MTVFRHDTGWPNEKLPVIDKLTRGLIIFGLAAATLLIIGKTFAPLF